jgi:hypothetical protein
MCQHYLKRMEKNHKIRVRLLTVNGDVHYPRKIKINNDNKIQENETIFMKLIEFINRK